MAAAPKCTARRRRRRLAAVSITVIGVMVTVVLAVSNNISSSLLYNISSSKKLEEESPGGHHHFFPAGHRHRRLSSELNSADRIHADNRNLLELPLWAQQNLIPSTERLNPSDAALFWRELFCDLW